jgi:hypothetical protein
MATTTENTSRTAHLLDLMKQGDDAFNSRDFAAMEAIHRPDMIAHVTGSAEPIYGREAHAEAMKQMFGMFPDWITVVTNVTGTFTGEMTLPDGKVVPGTGKAFDVEFAQTVKWDEDVVSEITASWDSALQAKQIGLA